MSEADDKFASDAVKRKVNMKKFLMTLALGGFALGASAQYQLNNNDFEGGWENCIPWDSNNSNKIVGHNPKNWTISNVFAVIPIKVGNNVEGKNSTSAVSLVNLNKIGNKVPAYLTLGKSWATAKVSGFSPEAGSEDGGTFGGINFTKHPDAISFDYKRDNSNGSEDAMVVAYSWRGTYTQKDVPGNTSGSPVPVDMIDRDRNILNLPTSKGGAVTKTENAQLVASVQYRIKGSTNGKWVNQVVDLDYGTNGAAAVEKFNVIFSATDYFDRTKIVPENSLTVDNVVLLYYHALSDLKYDGVTLNGFSEDKLSYDLSDVTYDASKVDYTKKGVAANVKQSYNEGTGVLTITVEGEDFSVNPQSVTTYTVQFAKQANQEVEYKNGLSVNVNEEITAPQLTKYKVITKPNGEISLALNNFKLNIAGEILPVGNIVLENVTVDGNHYTANQVIRITEGDDPTVEDWAGPGLDEVPVKLDGTLHDGRLDATIDIDMSATLEQVIKVILAPLYEATPAKALTIPADGLGNVTFNRTFSKGWNTFVAPFPVTKKQLGYEKANTLASISTSAGWLKFDDVADETLEANKPYLLYYSADQTPVEFYYGGEVLSTTGEVKATATAHDGAKVSMVGNYTPQFCVEDNYFLSDVTGKDEIAKAGARSVVDATKCYFTFENVPNPAALSVKFGGDVTGMGNVVAEETAPRANGVYNLQGVKLSNGSVEGLPAGLYIVNGRKVLVK